MLLYVQARNRSLYFQQVPCRERIVTVTVTVKLQCGHSAHPLRASPTPQHTVGEIPTFLLHVCAEPEQKKLPIVDVDATVVDK